MASVFAFITYFIVVVGFASAVPSSYSALLVPEHRSELALLKHLEEISSNYEYYIVPADAYSVAEFVNPNEPSIWDYIPLPKLHTAIATIGSKIAAIGKFIIINGAFVILGVALVIGFCAFTPYCTLVIEKPFARQFGSFNVPYLDDVEYFFRQAYEKYHEL